MDASTKIPTKDLFKKYEEEIRKIIALDELNMRDIQMNLPAQRHYWISRLMGHKQEIISLKNTRKKAIKKLVEKLKLESPVGMSTAGLKNAAEDHDVVQKIDEEIAYNELLVEYLSKVEANIKDTGFSIKNMLEIIKLETT